MEEYRIVQRLKAGDRRAFDELYERYKTMLFRSACLLLGNTQDAEDVLQETFLSAYMHIGELKDDSLFKPWIFRILMRQVYRCGKKKSREFPDEDVLKHADAASIREQGETDPAARVVNQMEIKSHLNRLPLKQRQALVLYYYNELSIKEMAMILQCREGTVKSRLHTAKKAMRQAMREDELAERKCVVVRHV